MQNVWFLRHKKRILTLEASYHLSKTEHYDMERKIRTSLLEVIIQSTSVKIQMFHHQISHIFVLFLLKTLNNLAI